MDVEGECTLVAIAIGTRSSGGGGAGNWWVSAGTGVIGAVDGDEESWLVGGGEGKSDPLLLWSSYEIILFGVVRHVRLETDRLKAGGR